MKELISIVLCIAVIFGVSVQGYVAAEPEIIATVSNQNSDEITATEFAQQLNALMQYSESLRVENLDDEDEFATARIVVKSENAVNTENTISVVSGFDDLWVLQYATPEDAENAYNYFLGQDGIEFVEADKKIEALSSVDNMHVPYEPLNVEDNLSWGVSYIGQDIFNRALIDGAYTLQEVTVAVIDTGVDHTHEFLEDRVEPTRINTSGEGERNSSMDDNGHGTQIAGVIVDNTLDNVTVRPYKVLDRYGNGTFVSVAAGINCAVKDGVDVINLSLGFYEDSEILKSAIINAYANDIFIVAAAGNDNTDIPYYPSSYKEVMRIAAINNRGVVANFSNYDDIDIAAPGVAVKTTDLNNSYRNIDGTSIASPFVAAVAATILSASPNASPEDLFEIIKSSAVDAFENNSEVYYGAGILYAPEAQQDFTNINRTEAPVFSHTTPLIYREKFELTITSATEGATIYYTTDRTVPYKRNPNAIVYDGNPILVDETVTILAVAYSDNAYRSTISDFSAIYAPYVTADEVTVDSDGLITSYTGTAKSVSIPETINGVDIKGIGNGVFDGKDMREVILASSATFIGDSALANNPNLKTVIGIGVTTIGDKALYGAKRLKNVIFGELTSIGAYSFYQAGLEEFEINENSFSLNIKKIQSIPEGAFMYSGISELNIESVYSISNNAFTECNALVNVYINYLSALPAGAFKGLKTLSEVTIKGLSIVPVGAFSTCEALEHIHMPDATFINSNAFENCVLLNTVELTSAQTVFSNAFSGCDALIYLSLPEMKGFEPSVATLNTVPKLPKNLLLFHAPKMETTVKNMFYNCPNILVISLPAVTELAEKTFNNCNTIILLDISSVRYITNDAFQNCTIMFADARSLVSTSSMPKNSGMMLSNNFIESTATTENLTIAGTPGTYIERYCSYKNYDFVGLPVIYNEIPEYITENSEMVTVEAVGFNLEYQWYYNTVNSTEGGTPIEGATEKSYTFTDADNAPFYYCEITHHDVEKTVVITTDVIIKDHTPADYTEYDKAVEKALAVNKSEYSNYEILEEVLSIDAQNRFSCEQEYVDELTQAILDAIENLKRIKITDMLLVTASTNLMLYETVKVIPVLTPNDFTEYEGISWSVDNEDVLIVTKDGYVRCIGDGTATVTAEITNSDGSVVTQQIEFVCELNIIEKIIAFFFSRYMIIYHKLAEKYPSFIKNLY